MKDPRKRSRIPIRIPVHLCTDPQGHHVKGDAVVVDLNAEGLGFETEAELKRGDLLFLKVALPISLACRVSYVKPRGPNYRCGASIQRIGFLDKLKLSDFVNNQIKKSKTTQNQGVAI
ncbi:MAG: PilZ domain-containing protein [Elusimicrobia bacterium]|nr:PilZ domain-containing protein [Elusimicrobiota bacterium]